MVTGSDTENTRWQQPEAPGLEAIADGFRPVGLKNEHELVEREAMVYDARSA